MGEGGCEVEDEEGEEGDIQGDILYRTQHSFNLLWVALLEIVERTGEDDEGRGDQPAEDERE